MQTHLAFKENGTLHSDWFIVIVIHTPDWIRDEVQCFWTMHLDCLNCGCVCVCIVSQQQQQSWQHYNRAGDIIHHVTEPQGKVIGHCLRDDVINLLLTTATKTKSLVIMLTCGNNINTTPNTNNIQFRVFFTLSSYLLPLTNNSSCYPHNDKSWDLILAWGQVLCDLSVKHSQNACFIK